MLQRAFFPRRQGSARSLADQPEPARPTCLYPLFSALYTSALVLARQWLGTAALAGALALSSPACALAQEDASSALVQEVWGRSRRRQTAPQLPGDYNPKPCLMQTKCENYM